MPVASTAVTNRRMDPNEYINFDMPQQMTGPYIPIPQFYNGRSIFITGGTGFMGKVSYYRFFLSPQPEMNNLIMIMFFFLSFFDQVLVEKLLRSCPGIKNIYLLMRPKRGQEVAVRLNELLNSPVSTSFYIFSSQRLIVPLMERSWVENEFRFCRRASRRFR